MFTCKTFVVPTSMLSCLALVNSCRYIRVIRVVLVILTILAVKGHRLRANVRLKFAIPVFVLINVSVAVQLTFPFVLAI